MTPEELIKAETQARLAELAKPASTQTAIATRDTELAEQSTERVARQSPRNPVAIEVARLRRRVDGHAAQVQALNQKRMARLREHTQLLDEQAAEVLRRRSARRGHIISGIVGFFAGSILAGVGYEMRAQRARANQRDEQLKQ